jgi:hypothetical protein
LQLLIQLTQKEKPVNKNIFSNKRAWKNAILQKEAQPLDVTYKIV